jgi:hypothetical protein
METYQYPLNMEKRQKEKIQEFADRERRSFNQTILLIIDKFLEEKENATNN